MRSFILIRAVAVAAAIACLALGALPAATAATIPPPVPGGGTVKAATTPPPTGDPQNPFGEHCYGLINSSQPGGNPVLTRVGTKWEVNGAIHAWCAPVPHPWYICATVVHWQGTYPNVGKWVADTNTVNGTTAGVCQEFYPNTTASVTLSVSHVCTGTNPWVYAWAAAPEVFNGPIAENEWYSLVTKVNPLFHPLDVHYVVSPAAEYYC